RDEPSALEKRLAAMLDELYSAPAACPRAATQVHTRGRGFVDLELRLESGELVRDLVLWIEVKHGAPVHGDQLSVYEQDLRDSVTAGAGRQLIVLAPRQSLPDERAVPTDVPVVTWQALARELQAWAAEHRPQQPTRFLLDECLTYLDEERLMDRGEFTAEMAQAIALREIASDTI